MKDARIQVTLILTLIVLLSLALFLCNSCTETDEQPAGITNLDSLTLADDLVIGDDISLTDDLTVTGAAAFNGGIAADTNKFTVADTSGNTVIAGTLGVTGDVAVNTNKLNITASSGNTAIAGTLDVASTLQYGANNLYPVGFASSGYQAVYGTSTITGTATAAHGLTTVTFALCTLGEDPTSGAGDAAMCTVAVSANVVTLKAWQDDFVSAATEANVDVHWLVIGQP